MRRIVVTEFISLDGVVEDPGGAEGYKHGGWTFRFNGPEGMKYKVEETFGHDAMLLGRVTYEGFAAALAGARPGDREALAREAEAARAAQLAGHRARPWTTRVENPGGRSTLG